nr:MAG TPA: hypothetical protein [Caudoviricetes sp.]
MKISKFARKRHYITKRSWQRSIRTVKVRSRCRHARRLMSTGRRYKGGR